MLLNELIVVSHELSDSGIQSNMFPTVDKHIGELDGFMITLSSATSNKHIKKISLVDVDGNDCVSIVGYFFKHNKSAKTFFHFQRMWTEPEYRSQGLMTELRQYLKTTWNISFLSDIQLTQAGLDMWRKVRIPWSVKIFDAATGSVIPWNNSTEKDFFVPEDEYEEYRKFTNHPIKKKAEQYFLISESIDVFKATDVVGVPGIPSWVVTPLIE
ncbi:MAG: hypothetical protein CTY12_00040 [Methylotenera sp.]|nr:MAG: hypothetical protein CTY12_00040 [Methylotenera sp.]